jgi:hypothetical protein
VYAREAVPRDPKGLGVVDARLVTRDQVLGSVSSAVMEPCDLVIGSSNA